MPTDMPATTTTPIERRLAGRGGDQRHRAPPSRGRHQDGAQPDPGGALDRAAPVSLAELQLVELTIKNRLADQADRVTRPTL